MLSAMLISPDRSLQYTSNQVIVLPSTQDLTRVPVLVKSTPRPHQDPNPTAGMDMIRLGTTTRLLRSQQLRPRNTLKDINNLMSIRMCTLVDTHNHTQRNSLVCMDLRDPRRILLRLNLTSSRNRNHSIRRRSLSRFQPSKLRWPLLQPLVHHTRTTPTLRTQIQMSKHGLNTTHKVVKILPALSISSLSLVSPTVLQSLSLLRRRRLNSPSSNRTNNQLRLRLRLNPVPVSQCMRVTRFLLLERSKRHRVN